MRLASQPAKVTALHSGAFELCSFLCGGRCHRRRWHLGLRRHNRTLDGEALDLDFAAFVDREVAGHRGWVKALAGGILGDLARPDPCFLPS